MASGVIANDERYEETAGNAVATLTKECPDCLVTLKPLINQTARLKFTLYSAEDDPFVHSLKMQTRGHRIVGAAEALRQVHSQANRWELDVCSADMFYSLSGNKNVLMYLQEPLIVLMTAFADTVAPLFPADGCNVHTTWGAFQYGR